MHPVNDAPGICSGIVLGADSSNAPSNAPRSARTYGRTYEQLLTSQSDLTLGDAGRGGRSDCSEWVGIEPLRADVYPLIEGLLALHDDRPRYPVHRSRHDERRAPISARWRRYVYERDGFRCVRCDSVERLTLDHILPWSALGSDHADNLRTLCLSCNTSRSNRRQADDNWRPLPVTYWCVDCDERPGMDPDARMRPSFCWWHRHPALGWPTQAGAHA